MALSLWSLWRQIAIFDTDYEDTNFEALFKAGRQEIKPEKLSTLV